MIKKIVRVILFAFMFGGIFFALGTVGSAELNLISLDTLFSRVLWSVGFVAVGFIGLKVTGLEYPDN